MSGIYHALRSRSVTPLTRHFPERGCIIDMGCGTGALAMALVDTAPGRRVIAIDHAPSRIRRLEEKRGTRAIEARVASMERAKLPPAMGVAFVDVLHYLDEPAQETVLAVAARALESGGVLLLREPDAAAGLRFGWNCMYEWLATTSGFTQARVRHYRAASDWAGLLEALGLEADLLRPARGLFADRVVLGRKR